MGRDLSAEGRALDDHGGFVHALSVADLASSVAGVGQKAALASSLLAGGVQSADRARSASLPRARMSLLVSLVAVDVEGALAGGFRLLAC